MDLTQKTVFLSASFPEPGVEWNAPYTQNLNPLKTASAVKAVAAAIFQKGGRLVFGGHPTITPLILNVGRMYAGRTSSSSNGPISKVYQSKFFEDTIPEEARTLEEESIGKIYWTDNIPGNIDKSLEIMREKMLEDNKPDFCVLIGGKDGIIAEFKLFRKHFPNKKIYPFGTTGGASSWLLEKHATDLRLPTHLLQLLKSNFSYPLVAEMIMQDFLQ